MKGSIVRPTRLAISLLFIGGLVISGIAAIPRVHASSPFFFSTGSTDGLMGMASRPSSTGLIEIEAADDFIVSADTTINHATVVGLLPAGDPLTDIQQVRIEIYRVFPLDSGPFDGMVATRTNSPSDNSFAERDSMLGDLTFTPTILTDTFTVLNTVVNGINKIPNQFTGGEGPVTGEEVSFDVTLSNTINLPAGHYFFVPQVKLGSGTFLWLSAPKPIVGGTGEFTPDLQTWIRNSDLAPDWSRVGTDITHQGPFNGTFSLSGTSVSSTVPEFPLPAVLASAIALAALAGLRRLNGFRV